MPRKVGFRIVFNDERIAIAYCWNFCELLRLIDIADIKKITTI
jgi:hypothetical protein